MNAPYRPGGDGDDFLKALKALIDEWNGTEARMHKHTRLYLRFTIVNVICFSIFTVLSMVNLLLRFL